jgi:hypothetical protein
MFSVLTDKENETLTCLKEGVPPFHIAFEAGKK